VQRARFSAAEVVQLTLDFYKRNYIEGLFLSSGIIRNSDYTMEQLVEVARSLREDHDFRGYIHLKTIPDASPELLSAAGLYADRLSINVELPTEQGLARLAPEKKLPQIRSAMGRLRLGIDESKAEKRAPKFAPAGQSTQMIIGADAADDRAILLSSANLYGNFQLRRVYYSAFSPIPDASSALPLQAPPLRRENRLYQADWLLRFYGFGVDEITPADSAQSGMLALDMDPKLAWALRNRAIFPVDLNTAAKELLLRVPGLGVRNVQRIVSIRRHARLRVADLLALKLPLKKLLPFISVLDHHPSAERSSAQLKAQLLDRPVQLSLF
jgi:putative DNA modification/repair radical SAM protein